MDTEGPGILNWLLEGLWKVHRDSGIGEPPAKVRALTDDYFEAADDLGRYLAERTERDAKDPTLRVNAKELYEDYERWCGTERLAPITSTAFGRRLSERGHPWIKNSKGLHDRIGLVLRGP